LHPPIRGILLTPSLSQLLLSLDDAVYNPSEIGLTKRRTIRKGAWKYDSTQPNRDQN
jgi:hypothetical protein